MNEPILHVVVTRYQGAIVHTRSFVSLDNAESYFDWKANNLDPADPKWPADKCSLVIAEVTTVKEKGAADTAPPVANRALAREHAQFTSPRRR